MKISVEFVIGLIVSVASAYYWSAIGTSAQLGDMPVLFRYTFRIYPYMDFVLTFLGMILLYAGLIKFRR